MCRVDSGQWSIEIKVGTVGIEPVPENPRVAIAIFNVHGAAMPISAGRRTSPMQRIADAGLVP